MTDRDHRPSPLPAPYVDPWPLLRRDLEAVLAGGRLRIWELWRRNRQGGLTVPSFWPAALVAWFWPLVLGVAVAVVVATVVAWVAMAGGGAPPLPLSTPADAAPSSAPPPPGAAEAPPAAGLSAAAASPPAPADPLGQAFEELDPSHWIRHLAAEPASSLLRLELAGAFSSLDGGEQRRWADQWLERSQALGYEQLELRDGQRRVLGRSARVGSGMILLPPPPAP